MVVSVWAAGLGSAVPFRVGVERHLELRSPPRLHVPGELLLPPQGILDGEVRDDGLELHGKLIDATAAAADVTACIVAPELIRSAAEQHRPAAELETL